MSVFTGDVNNNEIIGTIDDDTLAGGLGDDFLAGDNGSDTYLFSLGDGYDFINNFDGITNASNINPIDRLVFGVGILPSDIKISTSIDGYFGDHIITLSIIGTDDSVSIAGWYEDYSQPIAQAMVDQIEFADGTIWTKQDVFNQIAAATNQIVGDDEDNFLGGTSGDDLIIGLDGDDDLRGDIDDSVTGGIYPPSGEYPISGNDTLIGGAGKDYLMGANGNDTYVFNRGDGIDSINNYDYNQIVNRVDSYDRIVFGVGITPDDIKMTKGILDNIGLVALSVADSGGNITIFGVRNATGDIRSSITDGMVDAIEFADGTVWTKNYILSVLFPLTSPILNPIIGDSGDNFLVGTANNDTLIGAQGNDTLSGGAGRDVYVFNLGDGQDVINTFESYINPQSSLDVLRFGTSIRPEDIEFVFSGVEYADDLVLKIKGTNDQITIENYFLGDLNKLQIIEFADGTVWSELYLNQQRIDILGSINNDILHGISRNEVIQALSGDDMVFANNGDDTLIGGLGNDTLAGGLGRDVYVFNLGDGQDVINTNEGVINSQPSLDLLRFGAGIRPQDIEMLANQGQFSTHLVLKMKGTTDQITIENYFSGDLNKLQAVEFADGSSWTVQQLMMTFSRIDGDETSNILQGNGSDNVIFGFGGQDVLYGNDGNDSLDGGIGHDVLYGGADNDLLVGGESWQETGITGYQNVFVGFEEVYVGEQQVFLGYEQVYVGQQNVLVGYQDVYVRDETVLVGYQDVLIGQETVLGGYEDVVVGSQDVYVRDDIIYLGEEEVLVEYQAIIGYEADGTPIYETQSGYELRPIYDTYPVYESQPIIESQPFYTTYPIFDSQPVYDTRQIYETQPVYELQNVYETQPIFETRPIYESRPVYETQPVYGMVTVGGNDVLWGEDGNDTLMGGAGIDYLSGGNGSDTYVFSLGDGQDVIDNADDGLGTDTLMFGFGIEASQINLSRIADANLMISIVGTTDSVFVKDYFASDAAKIDKIQFADGTEWSVVDVLSRLDLPPVLTGNQAVLYNGSEDSSYTFYASYLLQGFTDANHDVLSVINLEASNGVLIDNQNGTYTFTPNANFSGIVNLSYQVSDATNHVVNATNQLLINPVNDAPILNINQQIKLSDGVEDTPYTLSVSNLLQGVSDIEGDLLSVIELYADYGSVSRLQNGNYVYTPDANFYGQVGIYYQVSDGHGGFLAINNSFNIQSVNDVPTLTDVQMPLANGYEDTGREIYLGELLQGYTDADGDALSITNIQVNQGYIAERSNGYYYFFTNPNFYGTVNLNYQITDGKGGLVNVSRNLTIDELNDAPALTGTPITLVKGLEDTPYTLTTAELLQGYTDIDGDALSVGNLYAENGSITQGQNGTYIFTPDENFNGIVNLSYQISDARGAVIDASNSFELEAVNDGIELHLSTMPWQAFEDQDIYNLTAYDLLNFFIDADGDILTVSNIQVINGEIRYQSHDTFTLAFAPDYNGYAAITYQISDGNGSVVDGVQMFDVMPVQDAPQGYPTAVLPHGTEDMPYTIYASDLLQGIVDVDGDALSIVELTSSNAKIINNQDGTFTFFGYPNHEGVVELNYVVTDGLVENPYLYSSFTNTFVLGPVNDAPLFYEWGRGLQQVVKENQSIRSEFYEHTFVDVDSNDTLTYSIKQANGQDLPVWLTFNPTLLLLTGTPSFNDAGILNLQLIASDGQVSTAEDFALTIENVNRMPTGTPSATLTNVVKSTATIYTVSSNDLLQGFSDADGDTLSIANLTADHATIVNNNNGTYTFNIDNNYDGQVVLNYDVTDGLGGTLAATQTFSVIVDTIGTTGADNLVGNQHDDSYLVNHQRDVVLEAEVNGGIDTVKASLSHILGDNLENLILTGTASLSGTGNELNNVLTGNNGKNRLLAGDGNDTLSGGAGSDTLNGGSGADQLFGGTGNDTFMIENTADTVTEFANEGFDTVNSFISYTLTANVERLILEGIESLNGFGNDLDNTVNGNNANNWLVGGLGNDTLEGKGGADILEGGLGDDIYYVDEAGDTVTELAGEGIDKVNSSVNHTLTINVEQLYLTGIAALLGVGNDLDNIIYGNSGNNALNGGIGNDSLNGGLGNDILQGGTGNDTLVGGLGDDTYRFGTDSDRDTINNQDSAGNDVLALAAGIGAEQVWLRQLGEDLEISIIGTASSVKIQGWYTDNSQNHLDSLKLSEGNILLFSEVQTLVNAMAAFTPPPVGQTSLTTEQRAALSTTIAIAWEVIS